MLEIEISVLSIKEINHEVDSTLIQVAHLGYLYGIRLYDVYVLA
ncbi:hypothetical protein [Candidatus Gullanella endobia]|nr:hypothetical protein [Candidatus Gullanella endobia]